MGRRLSDTRRDLDAANKSADWAETSLVNTRMELELLQEKLHTVDDVSS